VLPFPCSNISWQIYMRRSNSGAKESEQPRSTVLFRRGDRALGMFLVLKGTVSPDFGVDSSAGPASTYGPGALVGLHATLTERDYSITATVTADAEVGFLATRALESLLAHPS
jgi:CRP-like cAMP-binding protein